jgi:hypothetical protein
VRNEAEDDCKKTREPDAAAHVAPDPAPPLIQAPIAGLGREKLLVMLGF